MRKYAILGLLPALLLAAACSTSKISIRKDALRQMQTIAVMPFSSTVADAKVTRESTEIFRSAMVASGFKVLEREKIDKILKEKELAQTGLIENKALEAGQLLGAEGTMLGEITAHEVHSEIVEAELPDEGPGKYDAKNDKGDGTYFRRGAKWFKKDKRDTFQFQIVVRLVSNIDSQTVLTVQNEYPVRTFSGDSGGLRPANIDQFRAQVLAQMSKDIEKAIREAKEK
ncbi:MAG TPA: CsgG/HfaB family protein [Turneriella sp.]|nr:CsgG/HfaB family protein [Turneriella sp.]HMY11359.1 CsgG/HfaB family protein [Turneriella sp.]HNA78486.1 CsgG/HfaB family protein [Turneriella sp.]HNE18764.1 CsgG/HfaB family protein [Turneriella sp.]HNL53221.1 CsgG/HfaB family protein [Turneriella sp.]